MSFDKHSIIKFGMIRNFAVTLQPYFIEAVEKIKKFQNYFKNGQKTPILITEIDKDTYNFLFQKEWDENCKKQVNVIAGKTIK